MQAQLSWGKHSLQIQSPEWKWKSQGKESLRLYTGFLNLLEAHLIQLDEPTSMPSLRICLSGKHPSWSLDPTWVPGPRGHTKPRACRLAIKKMETRSCLTSSFNSVMLKEISHPCSPQSRRRCSWLMKWTIPFSASKICPSWSLSSGPTYAVSFLQNLFCVLSHRPYYH